MLDAFAFICIVAGLFTMPAIGGATGVGVGLAIILIPFVLAAISPTQ